MKFKFYLLVFLFSITFTLNIHADQSNNNFEISLNKKNYLILNSLILENYKNKIILPNYKKKLSGNIIYENKKIPIRLWLDGLSPEHFDKSQIKKNTLEIRVKKKKYFLNSRKFRLLSSKAFRYDFPLTYNEILKYFEIPHRYIVPVRFSLNSNSSKSKKTQDIFLLEEKIGEDYLDRNFLRQSMIFERDLYDNKAFIDAVYKQRNGIFSQKEKDIVVDGLHIDNKEKLKIINKPNNENVGEYAKKSFLEYLNKKQSAKDTFNLSQISKVFAIHTIMNMYHALGDHNLKFYFNPFTKKLEILPTDPHLPTLINKSQINNDLLKNLKNHEFFFRGTWYENLIEDGDFRYEYLRALKNLVNNKDFIYELENFTYIFSKKKTLDNIEVLKKNIKILQDYFSENELISGKDKYDKSKISKHFNIDHNSKKIYLLSDTISEPLKIGDEFSEYELVFDKNIINFTNSGSIIINSNFSCNNDSDQKIEILSKSKFNFIYFFGKATYIKNCEFKNFDYSLSIESQFTTSPITFYKTNLTIENANFENSKSEDLVNIVDSEVIIENMNLKNSYSDALDIDNSHGEIKDLKIKNCNNDCLDFSSSIFQISNLLIENFEDKGVSIGENSDINIKNSIIKNCKFICIAIKDSSFLKVEKTLFENGLIGIAEYVKKNIFNEPKVNKNDLKFKSINHYFIKEKNLEEIINLNL